MRTVPVIAAVTFTINFRGFSLHPKCYTTLQRRELTSGRFEWNVILFAIIEFGLTFGLTYKNNHKNATTTTAGPRDDNTNAAASRVRLVAVSGRSSGSARQFVRAPREIARARAPTRGDGVHRARRGDGNFRHFSDSKHETTLL